MDGIIKIIELTIWPLTVLIVAIMFRKPMLDLIPLIKKLKYKDMEIEFYKEASKLAAKVDEELPVAAKEEVKKEEEGPKVLFSRKALEPSEYINDGWFLLQRGIFDLASRASLGAHDVYSPLEVAKLLNNKGVLDKEKLSLFSELLVLRNRLAHATSEIVDYDVAREFHRSARRFEGYLKSINPSNNELNQDAP